MHIIDFFIVKNIFENTNLYDVYKNSIYNKHELIKNKKFIAKILNEIPVSIRKACKIKKSIIKIKIMTIESILNDNFLFKKIERLRFIADDIVREESYMFELTGKINGVSKLLSMLGHIKQKSKFEKEITGKKQNFYELERVYNYSVMLNNNKKYNLYRIIEDFPKIKIFFNQNNKVISEKELTKKFIESSTSKNIIFASDFLNLFLLNNKNFEDKYLMKSPDDYTNKFEEIDKILFLHIKEFLETEYMKKNNNSFIFKNRLGITPFEKSTLDNIGQKLNGLTRERVRQIEEKIIDNFILFMKIDPQKLKIMLMESIVKCENIEEKFPCLKKFFSGDIYYFLSKITDYKQMESDLFPEINMCIFEEYHATNPSPYSFDEIQNIIIEKTDIKEHLTERCVDNLVEKGFILKRNNLFYLDKITKSSILANYLLKFKNGISANEIKKLIKSDKGFLLNKSAFNYNSYAYLYGKGIYRHTKFFFELFDDENIKIILLYAFKFISNRNSDVKLKDLHHCIKKDLVEINYFDLRFIISSFGMSKNIYFDGKSGYDLISINKIDSHNIKEQIMTYILSKGNKTFTIQEFEFVSNYSPYSINMLISTMVNDCIILKVDNFNYILSNYAFEELNIENMKSEILKFLTLQNSKPFTLSYIEEKMNKMLKVRFHKNYYLSFLRYYRNDLSINFRIIENNLVTFKEEHDKSLSKMCAELIDQCENKDCENIILQYLSQKVDASMRELRNIYLFKTKFQKI